MKYFYLLILSIPVLHAMENPDDDAKLDVEMQGEPGSTQSRTSSTPTPSSSKSVSRMPTIEGGSGSNPGSQTSSFPLLPYPYEGVPADASDSRIQQFEKDIENLIVYHVKGKTFPQQMGDFWKGLSHIQIKVLSDKIASLRHSFLNDEGYGLKTIFEFFQITRPEFKRGESATFFPGSVPEKQPKTFLTMFNEVLDEKITTENQKRAKSNNYKFYVIAGITALNTVAIAGSFAALYVK